MNQNKKLYIITAIISFVGILYFGVNEYFRHLNVDHALSHNKIAHDNLKVYKVESFIDEVTKTKVKKYKITFDDLNLKKSCHGFVVIFKDGTIQKDLDCN